MSQVLVDGIDALSEMLLILEGETSELAIDPASSGSQEGALASQLSEHVGLEKRLNAHLQVSALSNVVVQFSQGQEHSVLDSGVRAIGL